MGLALTALQIMSSYAGLLKTTDNAVINGTLRTITDAMGNDSALQVSTAGVASLGTFAAVGNATVGGTFGVTGTTTLGGAVTASSNVGVLGTLNVAGVVTLSDDLDVADDADVGGSLSAASLSVSGNANVTGTLGVTGLAKVGGLTPVNSPGVGIPGTPAATGTITWDTDYVYVCIGQDGIGGVWKRAAISTY
jgi:hypothetical protein